MGRFVIVAYKPKPGMDEALLPPSKSFRRRSGLSSHCGVPYAMRAAHGTIVEVFEWRSADAIHQAHTNAAVQVLWGEFGAACDYVPLANLAEVQQMFAEFEPVDLSLGAA